MKLATSQLTGEVSVIGSIRTMRIGPGATVDLDVEIAPGVTLADGLGALAESFVAVDRPAAPAATPAPRRGRAAGRGVMPETDPAEEVKE
jgi:hypothetical protein